tara:strand:+ start:509 stop:700 length:192 start_codon:yes stop_codon:yes gene_type:complete
MSNAYTEKIKPLIIKALEVGDYTISEIANAYSVSVQFVSKVRDGYDEFYVDLKRGYKEGYNKK